MQKIQHKAKTQKIEHAAEVCKTSQLTKFIWQLIFSNLRPADLVRVSLTCKNWNQIITGNPHLREMRKVFVYVFGREKWGKYFGDVGEEPPLPQDIEKILSSSCPFWPSKKVSETHLLVLIPETVNGKSHTINSLGEIIKNPKTGHSSQYRIYNPYVKNEQGEKSFPSHWVLLTKNVIPNSRNKSYSEQKELMEDFPPYTFPNALDIATALLMHHVKRGERLCSNDPLIYTRCIEIVDSDQWPVAIGGFSVGGIEVSNYHNAHGFNDVVGCRKFFL